MSLPMPPLLYGTAWKKERTCELVVRAITLGFRGIDTACQPKHYNEAGVGEAIKILRSRGVERSALFIQTKFTPISGQDTSRPLPYNPSAPLATQVAESFVSTQNNLGTNYVDSLVLHSPLKLDLMLEVWHAMEEIHHAGGARMLGISNCYDVSILRALYDDASVKPRVVQNRFYSDSGFDTELRSFCASHGIVYQSFWTLTANPDILKSSVTTAIAKAHGWTSAQVLFRFLSHIGIVPLSGTQSEVHMREDVAVFASELSTSEIARMQAQIT